MPILVAFDLDDVTTFIERTSAGLVVSAGDGSVHAVEERPLPELLASHGQALLPSIGNTVVVRSEAHSGVELGPMLERAFGEPITEPTS